MTELIQHIDIEAQLEQKRLDLTELEQETAERETYLTELQANMRMFESRYLNSVGVLYDELAAIEKECSKIQGLDYDVDSDTEGPDDDADEDDNGVSCGQNLFQAAKLKKLYHDVARKFHPDLAQCEDERRHRHQLMIEANRAYETGEEDRLTEMLEEGLKIESVSDNSTMSTEMILLIRKINAEKHKYSAIGSKINEITSSDIYKLKLRVDNGEAMGIDLMEDMLSQLRRQIIKAKNRLEHLQLLFV